MTDVTEADISGHGSDLWPERPMRVIQKWNPALKAYEPYTVNPDWKLVLYTQDMDEAINCANCGKEMTYGDGYTSRMIHTVMGLGYPVCEDCYFKEEK